MCKIKVDVTISCSVVYVLHAFQKKSKSGIKTDRPDIDLIKQRLSHAKEHYDANFKDKSRVSD